MTRNARRLAEKTERRSIATGIWAPWKRHDFPRGSVGASGWLWDIDRAYANGLYAVLVRQLDATDAGRLHLAIRTPTNLEPPWRDMQRIKNELFGPERFAVQVCPPDARLIDQADMYHLWVMAEGYRPGFGLHRLDEAEAPIPCTMDEADTDLPITSQAEREGA